MYGYNYLLNFLNSEGFRKDDHEKFFSFKFEGTSFLVFKHDSPVLQVILLLNADGFSRSKMLEACNKLNDENFIVKFVAQENTIWCCYEMIPSENTSKDEFSLIMTFLDKTSDEMYKELKK